MIGGRKGPIPAQYIACGSSQQVLMYLSFKADLSIYHNNGKPDLAITVNESKITGTFLCFPSFHCAKCR